MRRLPSNSLHGPRSVSSLAAIANRVSGHNQTSLAVGFAGRNTLLFAHIVSMSLSTIGIFSAARARRYAVLVITVIGMPVAITKAPSAPSPAGATDVLIGSGSRHAPITMREAGNAT